MCVKLLEDQYQDALVRLNNARTDYKAQLISWAMLQDARQVFKEAKEALSREEWSSDTLSSGQ